MTTTPNMADFSALIIDDPEFSELSDQLDQYCPFDALGVSRYEIRHSNYLADILSPTKPHGFGDQALRSTLDLFMEHTGSDLRLDLHFAEINDADVRREWRDIDLLIRLPALSVTFAVEIKIESKEHSGQLQKYNQIVTDSWPNDSIYLIYLSVQETAPSDESWIPVNFLSLVDRLESDVIGFSGTEISNQMLRAYINMFRRRYLADEHLEELARKVWNRHAAALEYLIERKPNKAKEISDFLQNQSVLDQLFSEFSAKTNLELFKEKSTPSILRLAVREWSKHPALVGAENWNDSSQLLICEVAFRPSGIFVYFLIGRGDAEKRSSIFNALKQAGVNCGQNRSSLAKDWARLASREIISLKIDEENTGTDHTKRVQKGVLGFLVEHASSYHEALRPLMQ